MLKKIRQRLLSDQGSATLVMGIISALFIALLVGFAIDVSKNNYLKSSLSSRAQQSSEIAMKDINARGYLRETAAGKFVQAYQGTSGSGFMNDETNNYRTTACSTRTVTSWDGKRIDNVKMPYIVVRYDTGRKIGTSSNTVVFVSQGGSNPVIVSGTYNPSSRYNVISADVQDSSTNVILGIFKMECQNYDSKVSAITFGSNKDIQK